MNLAKMKKLHFFLNVLPIFIQNEVLKYVKVIDSTLGKAIFRDVSAKN
ncbi:MAG: hypothetical protein ACI8YQ_001862 [Polaribacter sp.]|jgi:hypothetical protein